MHSLPSSVGTNVLSTKSYIFSGSDSGRSILLSGNASLSTGLSANWTCDVKNITNTKISITPLSGLIDGKTLINLYPNESCTLVSDGTNIFVFNRSRAVVMQTVNLTTNPTTTTNLDLTGLADPEMVNIQFDFSMGLSVADYLHSAISLNSSFIVTGSSYGTFYTLPLPGNYSQGSNVQTSKWYNYNYTTDQFFIGTINLMGFGTNRLSYKSQVGGSANYVSLCNGIFSNGSIINNFDGFRFISGNGSGRFNSGLVNVTGYRN